MKYKLIYNKYLRPNHLVLASVEGSIFADIISEHCTEYAARRALWRLKENMSNPPTGIKFTYQKNECY